MPALPVILPLLTAAMLAAGASLLHRRLLDLIAILITALVCVVCLLLVYQSSTGVIVYWFGGWAPQPSQRFPIGISFAVDSIGAGLAALTSFLMLGAFVFSWAYFESVKAFYHGLMLVFLAGMCGLCLTGDLFNLFVWFELMTAAAVGLCGYKPEERWPLLGSLNFAVCNTVGAFLSLSGVALLYAFTGSLNMSEVGHSLLKHDPGRLFVTATFLLVITGFLVKAAAFPFHFWLADAHAVAPTPVCILLSGAMVELGVYAVARLYFVVFAPLLGADSHAVATVLITMGALGAIVGGVFCFAQRHLKRLLAFSTISHIGLMFIALGLLKSVALAGLALYIVGHGLIKGALFICAGVLLDSCGSVDEFDMRGHGRKTPLLGVMMAAGACGLAGLPPFATFYGNNLISQAEQSRGMPWLSVVTLLAEALTAGAVLRAAGRIYLGLGATREATSRGAAHIPMEPETTAGRNRSRPPASMWAPAAVMLLVAAVIALFPQWRAHVLDQATRFRDGLSYQGLVLENRSPDALHIEAVAAPDVGWRQVASLGLAVTLAALTLFPGALGAKLNRRLGQRIVRGIGRLRSFQTGRVGDYVAWIIFGVAIYGVALLAMSK